MSNLITVKASDVLPDRVADNAYPEARGSRYGELATNPFSLHRSALEGNVFIARNATQATGIAQTANTTSDTTKPFITLTVGATAVKSVHLIYLILKPTAVSSGQTTQRIDIVTCDGTAWSSAGTNYNQIASGIATAGYHGVNTGKNESSVLSNFYVGVPVTVLGTNSRNVVRFVPRQTTIPVIADTYGMRFGAFGGDWALPNTGAEPVSTTVNQYWRDFLPLIIAPGTSAMVIPWAASIAGAMSWEFELAWLER